MTKTQSFDEYNEMMTARQKMPIGIQDFGSIRREGYVYVDKTRYMREMTEVYRFIFLTRPRRFGKSLMVSTLEEYFLGHKELFKGLYIDGVEKKWKEHPVFRFDMSGEIYDAPDSLTNAIDRKLKEYERVYGTNPDDFSLPTRFQSLLKNAYEKTGLGCVVLVDEYDKPLLESEDNIKSNKVYRQVFKSFFGVLKGYDKYVRFAFFTGITKFRNVSIFSDLNNLNDISMDKRFSGICGITQQELETHFATTIESMAQEKGIAKEECIAHLKIMYDGYHFAKDLLDVYNPFSLLNALDKLDAASYWVGQTTPSYLIDKLKNGNYYPYDYTEGKEVDQSLLGMLEESGNDPTQLLFQSGYLTIKSYDDEFGMFTLVYPNKEVREGFTKWLVPVYLNIVGDGLGPTIRDFTIALRTCDMDALHNHLVSIYASLPYYEGKEPLDKVAERDVRNVAHLIFTLLGSYTFSETHFSRGRCDCLVINKDYVYIFEFKVDKTAAEALAQIETHGYAGRFENETRQVVKVGLGYSSEKRNIADFCYEMDGKGI